MLRKLALGVVSFALTIGMLELGVRLAHLEVHDYVNEMQKYGLLLVRDPAGYFRHPLSTSAVLQGVTVRFNSLGMRGEEPRSPKPAGIFRILCLGDSVTLGPAVTEDAIYPSRLGALLDDGRIDVVAAGVAGWNTVEEEHFLAANIERIDPDLVVLLYVSNDNEPLEPWRRAQQPPESRWAAVYRALVLHSRLFEWAAFTTKRLRGVDWAGLREVHRWNEELRAAGPPFSPTDPGWLESRAALGRLLALTRAHGARLAIFLYNLEDWPPAPTARDRLEEFGQETGVPVFDTLPFFAGPSPATLVNAPFVDPHPNAEGHALLATGMARVLRAAGLLSPPSASRSRSLATLTGVR